MSFYLPDEATASVDRRTDELLQEALQESFKGGTIIAVAHRLETIIDFDIVVVLGHGRVGKIARGCVTPSTTIIVI